MFIVREKKHIGCNKYEIFIDQIKIKEIYIKRIKRERNNYEYLFLIDSSGKNIEEVFFYLNCEIGAESINSREQAQSALKVLYTFKEIIKKEFIDFNENDIKNLSDFILGTSAKGIQIEISNLTYRSIGTHNTYFEGIRKFLFKMGIENKYFFERVDVANKSYVKKQNTYKKEFKYKTNLNRHSSFTNKVPKYISASKYEVIMTFLDEENSSSILRDKVIIKLMFLFGLRLGEVLGLTIEDLKENKIYIRNRITDKEYQKAKTCFAPQNKDDYKTKAYDLKTGGTQEVFIIDEIMEEINEYLDVSRDILGISQKKLNNILINTKADSIEGNRENFYIFISLLNNYFLQYL
ncbi:MAG: hypothetical protein ACRCYE_06270 [Sarcina sp.]